MRWVVFGVRLLFVVAASGVVLAAPKTPGWQFIAGFLYPMGVLVLLNLLDGKLDIVDVALYGMTGVRDVHLTPRSVLRRAFAVVAFWFVLLALGLVIGVYPLGHVLGGGGSASHDLEGSRTVLCFLAGTLTGAVSYLAAVGWYWKSIRLRYGY